MDKFSKISMSSPSVKKTVKRRKLWNIKDFVE